MSCDQNSGKIARLACQISSGISGLASKRSFYAGVAVGVVGMAGTLALVNKLRRKNSLQPFLQAQLAPTRQNPVRAINAPVKGPVGTRANPRPLPKETLDEVKGTRANPKPIPILSAATATLATETKLQPAALQVRTGDEQTFTAQQSYHVVRLDGTDTGLAITPYLRQEENGQLIEDQQAWGVTHTNSGSLISGPYKNIAQAQGLAAKLSSLRWTASVVPASDVARARRVVAAYQPLSRDEEAA